MSGIDLLRLVVGASFLSAAAVFDWRSRVVRDPLWLGMGSIGLVLFGADLWLAGVDPVVALVLVPASVLLFSAFFGEEFQTEAGWRFPLGTAAAYLIGLAAALYPIVDLYRPGDATALAQLRTYGVYLTSPVMMLVFRGMYEAHLLKGGADAKAMIAIAALVPAYPSLEPFPAIDLSPRLQDTLALVFPFAFLVLLNAALLLVFLPLAFLAVNASRGHAELPQALVGYKVRLDAVPKNIWFMDQIEDGERVLVYFPTKRQDRAAIAKALREAGLKEAWVTPQLPFMVPLAVAFVLSFLLGNPLMGLLQAALPGP